MRAPRTTCLLILCAGLAAGTGRAGEVLAAPGRLALTTDRVVVFKDGFALFIKKAAGTADGEGRVFTESVPDGAVLGTFWAASEDGQALGMRAEWVETKSIREEETACTTLVELLRANTGKAVTLGLSRENAVDVSGTIVEVLDLPPEESKPREIDDPARSAIRQFGARPAGVRVTEEDGRTERTRELVPRGGLLVVVQTEKGRVIQPVSEIRTLLGPEIVTKMKRREEVEARTKRLSFDLGAEAAGKAVSLRVLYFTEGVRWIPTYRISGPLDKEAQLALQGEVINEAEDFDAAVDLVVGVPNFRFKQTVSPLTLEATLRQALAGAAPNLMGQSYSNSTFQLRAREHQAPAAGDGGAALNLAPELAAAQSQDLFVYQAKRLALKKGARATVPLWQLAAPLRHLYTMDVKVVRDGQSGGVLRSDGQAANAGSPLKLEENQVWHQLELANASAAPWTTGAALILQERLPLGQDLLTYTPAGGRVLLPVTVAVDMCGSFEEEELSRRANAISWNRNQYAEVRKRATVTVTNQRRELSRTRVTVSLGGRAENASDAGKVVVNDFRNADWGNSNYRELNNHSDLSWDLELKPGETKKLAFEFTIYVP
ncbi:MAG: hypothetical protein M5U26_03990 [Planctomycetota bacterium]|nr:hypothetical protein [Planctomycetota bacterium]